MHTFPDPIDTASSEFTDISARLLGLHEVRPSRLSSKVSPSELLKGIEQFFEIARQAEHGLAADLTDKDITQIGDYDLSMLMDLEPWIVEQKIEDVMLQLKKIALSKADWIMRHGGQMTSSSVVPLPATNILEEQDALQRCSDHR